MSKIAFIQLARYGDIVNILPICWDLASRGNQVSVYVHSDFAAILEAVGYVTPIAWPTLHRDVKGAYDDAVGRGFDQIFDTQIDGHFRPPPRETESFLLEAWSRTGYLNRFHDLPLIFDRRDEAAEYKIKRTLYPRFKGDQKILAYSLFSCSSPFHRAAEFEHWLKSNVGFGYIPVDIGRLNLSKVHHLLGLIEACDVLLTVDTLHLHLSYAFNKPTIALHLDRHAGTKPGGSDAPVPLRWYWSEPRSHWIGSMDYAEANADSGRQEILRLLNGLGEWDAGKYVRSGIGLTADGNAKVLHICEQYAPSTDEEAGRNAAAFNRWESIERADANWKNLYFNTMGSARRSSRDLGDSRNLPYLHDVIDHAVEKAGPGDIVCLTNADSILPLDAAAIIRRELSVRECCYSRRVHTYESRAEYAFSHKDMIGLPVDAGCDLFAFTAKWWRENSHEIPDFLLGCDVWDCVFRRVMLKAGGREIKPPMVLHVYHAPFWRRPENVETNPGQKHNRWLFRQWAVKNGISPVI